MPELEEEERRFIERVIQKNREGLERLAREEHAAEHRESEIRALLRQFYRDMRRLAGLEEEKASFSRIEP